MQKQQQQSSYNFFAKTFCTQSQHVPGGSCEENLNRFLIYAEATEKKWTISMFHSFSWVLSVFTCSRSRRKRELALILIGKILTSMFHKFCCMKKKTFLCLHSFDANPHAMKYLFRFLLACFTQISLTLLLLLTNLCHE